MEDIKGKTINQYKKRWSFLADEDIRVSLRNGNIRGYGSELAILRLLAHYRRLLKYRFNLDDKSKTRRKFYIMIKVGDTI